MMAEAKVGDYIVYTHSFGYDTRGPVGRITDASAFVPKHYGSKERRISFEAIVFSGDKAAAEKLNERLASSRAQLFEEQQKASERHIERDRLLIQKATPEFTAADGGGVS